MTYVLIAPVRQRGKLDRKCRKEEQEWSVVSNGLGLDDAASFTHPSNPPSNIRLLTIYATPAAELRARDSLMNGTRFFSARDTQGAEKTKM